MAMTNNMVGKFAGITYDWRQPSMARFKSQVWHPLQLLLSPSGGKDGYDIYVYATVKPIK